MVIKLSIPIKVSELYSLFGKAPSHDRPIDKIVTNSKEADGNSLFIALDGAKMNGDDYLPEARSHGALTLSSRRNDSDIYTENTEDALLSITTFYKEKLRKLKHTVAITGSVGKTTTKNILNTMLSNIYKTHATEKNYNNYLGCAYTVLTAPADTEILVIEAGMNHKGELSRISKAISPTVSVITNVGSAHIGNLGSKEAIAAAKLEILDGMKNKLLVIPKNEDPRLTDARVYTFSLNDRTADLYIRPTLINNRGSSYEIHTDKYSLFDLKTSLVGGHILNSIAAAVSVFNIFSFSRETLLSSLKNVDKAETRGKFITAKGLTFLDDTYSASPEAVISMINQINLFEGKKSAVIGDMYELGEKTEELHRAIGKAIAENGFVRLFAFGIYAEYIKSGATASGMKDENIFINTNLSSPDKTADDILTHCDSGEIILVKASRKVCAERIIECIDKK